MGIVIVRGEVSNRDRMLNWLRGVGVSDRSATATFDPGSAARQRGHSVVPDPGSGEPGTTN
jgi:hypothetical protein